MKFGICLPDSWGVEDVHSIFRLATSAEDLGFDSVWVSEHVFNVSYVYERIGSRPYYEPLTILSYVAAITHRVALGTSVLVLPYHNPIRLAKMAATLDVMSRGRLLLGVGVGVIREEMEAMGSPFAERGAITDESIAVMKELWTQEDPIFRGTYCSFPAMKFSPKPMQKPHIPLLIGGVTRSAIRRAARAGNGWHPIGLPPRELARGMVYLGEQAEAGGRNPLEIPVSLRLDMAAPSSSQGSRGRYQLTSDPEEVLEAAHAFQEVGVEELTISPLTGDTERIGALMDMLSRRVIPTFR